MTRFAIGALIFVGASAANAEATDFGIRTVDGKRAAVKVAVHPKAQPMQSSAVVRPLGAERATYAPLVSRAHSSLTAAARLGAQWGRVTSTWRSVGHNRAVGGVPNSFHLRGRAIDIARRPGVTHSMIASAYRSAGYQLIESLDEGDHSHFAFSFGGETSSTVALRQAERGPATNWGIITVASAVLR